MSCYGSGKTFNVEGYILALEMFIDQTPTKFRQGELFKEG